MALRAGELGMEAEITHRISLRPAPSSGPHAGTNHPTGVRIRTVGAISDLTLDSYHRSSTTITAHSTMTTFTQYLLNKYVRPSRHC